MRRHEFRWQGLAFGLLFLAIVGNWSVWKQDILTPHELTLTVSGVLIVLGLIGVAVTVWQSRPPRAPSPSFTAATTDDPPDAGPTPEGPEDEEDQPQP